MEVQKQNSEVGSFMDYTQGPSNIDVHPVYETTQKGASKGILGSRGQLSHAVLDAQEEHQQHGIEAHVEGDQAPAGDAEYEAAQRHANLVEGSSHVHVANIETGHVAVQRIGEIGIETGVDPIVLNSQVAEFNQHASSNLITNPELAQSHQQHINEQIHTGVVPEVVHEEVRHEEVPVHKEEVPAHHEAHHEVEHKEEVQHPTTEQKVTNEELHNATNPATNLDQGQTVHANVGNDGEVVGQKEEAAFDTKGGLVTKGTLVFKPLEFRFVGDKNEKQKVKPKLKVKVGGHSGSLAGQSTDHGFSWGESVSVGYSNQDDATLEIKKSGMFGKSIAAGKIALGEIIANRKAEQTVDLLEKEKVVGQLKVEVEFKPKAK